MKWKLSFGRSSLKFIEKGRITEDEITEIIKKTLLKFLGEDLNIDIKKLKGEWAGFHRVRIGKLRIIAEFNFDEPSVFIERIDYRGGVY